MCSEHLMVQFLSDAEVDAILEFAEKQDFTQGECKGEGEGVQARLK